VAEGPKGPCSTDGGCGRSAPTGLSLCDPKIIWAFGRAAQFDTLRLRLIKIAARGVEMKTMMRIHLPTTSPAQAIVPLALSRIPPLVI
jgi:hypothetical protein